MCCSSGRHALKLTRSIWFSALQSFTIVVSDFTTLARYPGWATRVFQSVIVSLLGRVWNVKPVSSSRARVSPLSIPPLGCISTHTLLDVWRSMSLQGEAHHLHSKACIVFVTILFLPPQNATTTLSPMEISLSATDL